VVQFPLRSQLRCRQPDGSTAAAQTAGESGCAAGFVLLEASQWNSLLSLGLCSQLWSQLILKALAQPLLNPLLEEIVLQRLIRPQSVGDARVQNIADQVPEK